MATKFTKEQLSAQLVELGYECIAPAKTLKQKFEDALTNLKKGKEPGKDFKKKDTASPTTGTVSDTVPVVDSEEKPATVPEAKPVKKIALKKKATDEPVPSVPVEGGDNASVSPDSVPEAKPVKKIALKKKTVDEPTPPVAVTTPPVADVVKEFDSLMSVKSQVSTPVKSPPVPTPTPVAHQPEAAALPVPQKRVEHVLLTGTISIKSEELVKILESATSLSSDDYTNILKALSSYCGVTTVGGSGDVVLKTKKQISSISASSKELELTKDEYITFKKHYTAAASAASIAEKTGLDVSKVYSAMMNSAKYASAYAH